MGFLVKKPKKRLYAFYILIIFMSVIALSGLIGLLFVPDGIGLVLLEISMLIFGSLSIFLIIKNRKMAVSRTASKLSIYCSKGEINRALSLIDKKIKSNYLGYRINWLNLKAMVLIKKGELRKADKILKKILEEHPNFQNANYHKACLESIRQNPEKSLKHLKKLLWIFKHTKKTSSQKNETKEVIIDAFKNDEDLLNVRKHEGFNELFFDLDSLDSNENVHKR